jgi:hypothetical protein
VPLNVDKEKPILLMRFAASSWSNSKSSGVNADEHRKTLV